MNVVILGGDGYCGWATALYLCDRGHRVTIADSGIRRRWDVQLGIASLVPIAALAERVAAWTASGGAPIDAVELDVTDYGALCALLEEARPDAVVHFAQQRSAPFSMMDRDHAHETLLNNTVGNLNLLWALHEVAADAHLVKLGTMGEYGTPNIDVEEGFITIEHKGRRDTLPFPKQPGSFYHLTKVSDSDQINFACRVWGLRATDLNQGVVYGVHTPQTRRAPELVNRYDYDHVFGTVLNRFCVQAALEHPLTVYGRGGQTRGFLDIRDTVRCVEIALEHPARQGEFRVFNQFTQTFSVLQLAGRVAAVARSMGLRAPVAHLENPRTERETHHYHPANAKLRALGLEPTFLEDELLVEMLELAIAHRARIDAAQIAPRVTWTGRTGGATEVTQPA